MPAFMPRTAPAQPENLSEMKTTATAAQINMLCKVNMLPGRQQPRVLLTAYVTVHAPAQQNDFTTQLHGWGSVKSW